MKGHPVILSNELDHVTHTPTNFWFSCLISGEKPVYQISPQIDVQHSILISHDLKKYKNELSSNFSLLLKKSKKLEKKLNLRCRSCQFFVYSI